MLTRSIGSSCAAALALALLAFPVSSAQALTIKECSAKYKAAQSAGTLNGMKWNDFRKAQCGPTASAAPAATPSPTAPTASAPTATAPSAAKRGERPARPPATTGVAPPGNAVFPTAVSPKYSSESAGRARMHTCLDQYNANKATNQNGGLTWIQKGGGYYSACNKRLKG